MNFITSVLLCCLLTTISYAQTETWELRSDKDGILAYTKDVPSTKFKEYLVETDITADFSQVLALFKDFESYPDLFPDTGDVKAYIDEPDRHVTYIRFKLPFPIKDRDAVMDQRISFDAEKRLLTIDVQCEAEDYETNKKLIRITDCGGAWEFKDRGDGTIHVKHNFLVDPGGAAPAWIVNSKVTKDPIKTLTSLRELVVQDRYKGKQFDLLD
ncbi:MAG: SRPBCC family protein [Bacteroidota bacterium]